MALAQGDWWFDVAQSVGLMLMVSLGLVGWRRNKIACRVNGEEAGAVMTGGIRCVDARGWDLCFGGRPKR